MISLSLIAFMIALIGLTGACITGLRKPPKQKDDPEYTKEGADEYKLYRFKNAADQLAKEIKE